MWAGPSQYVLALRENGSVDCARYVDGLSGEASKAADRGDMRQKNPAYMSMLLENGHPALTAVDAQRRRLRHYAKQIDRNKL